MNARLCSMLVAGGVVLISAPHGTLQAAPAASVTPATTATLQSVAVQGDRVILAVPGFQGTVRLQVLTGPDRVVADFPGVVKGVGLSKKDFATLPAHLVVKARAAQFALSPEPVTRVVLEVKPGVQVQVAQGPETVEFRLSEQPGAPVQAALIQGPVLPVQAEPVTLPMENEVVSQVLAPSSQTDLPQGQTAPVLPVPRTPLSVLPEVGSRFQALPSLAIQSLMTTSLAPQAPAEPKPAAPSAKPGRTLGDGPQKYTGAKMSIDVQGADLVTFLRILADAGKLNLIVDQDVQGTFSFKFTDTPWDQILDVILKHAGLGKEINNGVLRVAKVDRLQKEETERKALEDAKNLAGETQSITRSLSYAKVGEAKPLLDKVLTKRGSVILDDRTNTLIITDLPKNLQLIDDLIATLDVQIQQVQIEARVVEASDGFTRAFGVKWPTSNSGDAKLGSGSAPWVGYGGAWNGAEWNRQGSTWDNALGWAPGKDGVTSIAGAAGEAWVSFISNRLSVNFILQALEKEGKVKIVSSPKLVTQNNKKAKILSGEKIPYPSQQGGAAGGAITVAFADANLELDVTPQITSEGTIIMDIKIEKAEADFSRTVQGTPTILRKAIETQVLVKDGGTAVLGGVYTTNKASGYTGVPFLGKLPIIGGLFRTKSRDEKSAELLIFLTPRILKNN